MQTMAARFKDAQDRYGKRWKHLEEERRTLDATGEQLKEKAKEVHTWYNNRSCELRNHEERMATTAKSARVRDGQLTEHEANSMPRPRILPPKNKPWQPLSAPRMMKSKKS